ncbi:peptidase domain-containing ABC transporter [Paenibacillus sp. FSL P2-0322]|uniref:peptidase domain-containing ABC transporter n=1 Tax=Paenibacillus sp. FSL P2-0322 TaxID=2921628 RepID=UPI0030D003AB
MLFRRIPYIEQVNQTECGISCLAMISAYYQHDIMSSDFQEFASAGRDGTTLLRLKQIAESIGFNASAYRIEDINQFKQIVLPAILHWNQNHYVVLEKMNNHYAYIIDPSCGRRKLSLSIFIQQFMGFVMVMTPTEKVVAVKTPNVWLPMLKLVQTHKKMFMYISLLTFMLQIAVVGMPISIQYVIDYVVVPMNPQPSITIISAIIGFVMIYMVITFARSRALVRLHNVIDYAIQTHYFSKLLRLSYPFFLLRSYGDLLFRANSLTIIRNQLSGILITGILDGVIVLVLSVYMLLVSPYMALLVFILVSVDIAFVFWSKRYVAEVNQQQVVSMSKLQALQSEILYGIANIKTSGNENQVYMQWLDKFNGLLQIYRRKEYLNSYLTTVSNGVQFMSPLIILGTGILMLDKGGISLTIGVLISFQAIATHFFSKSSSIMNMINSFILTSAYLRRIHDVLEAPTEHNEGKLQVQILGEILLSNVTFSYSRYSPKILKNINIHIKRGQKVAIIGHSGSGKSTLTNLLIGLLSPTAGHIYYDGNDMACLDMQFVRRQMGIVSQDVTLFNRSIYDNIALHQVNVTLEDVIQAAKAANIHDEIMAMPMQYQTMVAEMGRNISGGQRQRIAWARAILMKPSVLILDEATTALDYRNEERIDMYLSSIHCTRIVITHQLKTVMNSDIIIVLENGRICDIGTHDQLLYKSKYYQEHYREMYI